MVWTLDTTEGRAPLVERNALLSEDAKSFIAQMHAADPKWCTAADPAPGSAQHDATRRQLHTVNGLWALLRRILGMLCRARLTCTKAHGRWTSWRLARLFGVREQRILAIVAIKELEARAGFAENEGDDADDGAQGIPPPLASPALTLTLIQTLTLTNFPKILVNPDLMPGPALDPASCPELPNIVVRHKCCCGFSSPAEHRNCSVSRPLPPCGVCRHCK